MGFRSQRQYTTNLRSYEDVKEAVQRNIEKIAKCDLQPEDDKGNFTFYLRKYPQVRIQVTSRKQFFKLHGIKPNEFLKDLKIIRELVSLLSETYPHGIDFKLDKETNSWHDKDDIINELEGIVEYNILIHAMEKSDRQDFIDGVWKRLDTDVEFRNRFAEYGNNFHAKLLCKNGFRCKPDGSLKLKVSRPLDDPFLEQSPEILLNSGFL